MIPIRSRASLANSIGGHIACAALILCLPAAACAETLADAIAAAYDRNPQLVQERYLQKARDEDYVQARAQYGPTITASVSGSYDHATQLSLAQNSKQEAATITAQQPVYSSGQLRGQVAAAKAEILGGRETLRQVEQETVGNVIIVYAAVLRDEARLEVGRENVEVLRSQLLQNKKRQEVGDVTLTDVAQSDSRLAAAELQLASLQANLDGSRGEYLQVVGHNPGKLEPLPQLGALPPTIDAAFDLAEQNNASVLIANYTEQQSSATAAATRGTQGPTISLTAEGRYSQNELFRFGLNAGTKELIGGFTINQPLFSSGAVRSRIRQADARNRADQAGIDLARRAALQSVTSAWTQLSAARIAVTTGERQVDSAQQAFAGMSCEELNGLRETIETLNAEQELQAAQLQLLASRYQVYVSHAQLLAAVGDLDAQQIASNITRYDPVANFNRVKDRWLTPFSLIAMGVDRIASANPRGPFSSDLAGANVPKQDRVPALADAPSRALMNKPLTPIRDSRLRLPDGSEGHCPLNDIRPRG